MTTTNNTAAAPVAATIVAAAPKAKVTLRDRMAAYVTSCKAQFAVARNWVVANRLSLGASAAGLVLAFGVVVGITGALKQEADSRLAAIVADNARTEALLKLETRKVEAIEASTAGIGTRIYNAGVSAGAAVTNADGYARSMVFGE